jgi:hypothetical protein
MAKKKLEGPLAKALRSKIGRTCWFRHDDGRIIQGVYKRGRKVEETTGVKRFEGAEGRGFNIDSTIWTVPRNIKITFGQAPHTPAAEKGGARG